eukprot:9502294-Pyramimonas_sp.AAC.1
MFCNITSWNQVTLDFLQQIKPLCDGFFVAEHHLLKDLSRAKRNAAQIGWGPHLRPALPSPGWGYSWRSRSCGFQ